jgi:hypothetical protein
VVALVSQSVGSSPEGEEEILGRYYILKSYNLEEEILGQYYILKSYNLENGWLHQFLC